MADQKILRLSAALLFSGLLLTVLAGLLHPAREAPNAHAAVFAEYAASANWTAVHLGQFAAFAVVIAGLLGLYLWLDAPAGAAGWLGRLGAVSAGVTLALYGVLQAVDGVALKRAVDAWVAAPAAEQAARFASAEAIRWLEEAVRSYQDIMLGLTFVLFAVVIARQARLPRPIGYLMGLCGLSYIAQGWVLGMEGFSSNHGFWQLPAYLFLLAFVIWLLASAWRMPARVEPVPRPAGSSIPERVRRER